MMGYERSDDYQPLFWVQGRPVHVTTLLVILHSFALVVCCLALGIFHVDLRGFMDFSSDGFLHHGRLWQAFTYIFYHRPSPWFLLDAAFLFIWGREVERFFGRKVFTTLYLALVAVTPLFLATRGLLEGYDQHLNAFDGSVWVNIGVFVIFATLYPSVQFFFGVACTWIAIGIVAIMTLQCIAYNLVNDGFVLWLDTAVAFFGTRYAKMGGEALSFLGGFRERFGRKPVVAASVRPRLKARRAVDTSSNDGDNRGRDVHESIDPLLDKISKHGLASLTHSERAVLEKARVSLLRKERGD